MFAKLIDLIYRLLYYPLCILFTFTHSFRFDGRRNVPASGPVLLIGNHQSYLDIPCMGVACRRRIYFVAKKPLFSNRILGWLMKLFGTIEVDNAGFSRAGLEGIRTEMENGHTVLVYPEGERSHDGKISELKPGVSLLVRRAPATIVPVGIAGAFDAWPRTRKLLRLAPPFLPWRRQRIAVSVGEPIDGTALARKDRDEILSVLTEALRKAVSRAERLRGNR